MLATATQSRVLRLAGIASLFSGAALLGHLLAGIALPLSLAVTVGLLLVAVVIIGRWAEGPQRRALLRLAGRAAVIAFAATLVYDGSRAILAQIDPSGFDPFAALPIFGALLLGPSASSGAMVTAGVAFHLLNGVTFGIAYAFVLGGHAKRSPRRALATGVGWGLFLETFQLTLYPGWLDITTYQEFVTITFLGHVCYGATLGLLGHRFLPPFGRPRAELPDDAP